MTWAKRTKTVGQQRCWPERPKSQVPGECVARRCICWVASPSPCTVPVFPQAFQVVEESHTSSRELLHFLLRPKLFALGTHPLDGALARCFCFTRSLAQVRRSSTACKVQPNASLLPTHGSMYGYKQPTPRDPQFRPPITTRPHCCSASSQMK